MIIRTGYVWTLPVPRRGRGLGAMPQLTGAQYAALTPAQQQAYGNGDPNFLSAGTTTPAPSSALLSTVNNPQFTTIPFGSSTTTTYTLDSRMAEWAAGAIAFPSSLMGADPVSEALAFAQSYCAQQAVPDCSNINAIASNYGAQVKAAFASNPPPTAQAGTTSSSQSTSVNSGGGSVVVNPSPPSQPVTDGSNMASTGSVSNVANGTTLTTDTTGSTDIIPGVPNAVLFLGAGAAVLLLVVGMGVK